MDYITFTFLSHVPVEPVPDMPVTLHQNYPNPFNPRTTIRYYLKRPSYTRLEIFESYGRLVKHLVNKLETEGRHTVEWNGRNETGTTAASGVYLYRLSVDGRSKTRKMILLR